MQRVVAEHFVSKEGNYFLLEYRPQITFVKNALKYRMITQKIIEEMCEELETLQKKNMMIGLCTKKIKEIFGIRDSRIIPTLIHADNRTLTNPEELNTEWENYIQDLFADNRTQIIVQQIPNEGNFPKLKLEVKYAIKHIPKHKNMKKCRDFRIISLISHVLKIYL